MRPGAAARERKKMTAGLELVHEEGGGEDGATLRDGRREDDEGVRICTRWSRRWLEEGDRVVAAAVSARARVARASDFDFFLPPYPIPIVIFFLMWCKYSKAL